MIEWVSIEDKMPELIFKNGSKLGRSNPVLTVNANYEISDENPEVQVLCKGGRGDLTTIYWGGFIKEVTHWMPIPELPKD